MFIRFQTRNPEAVQDLEAVVSRMQQESSCPIVFTKTQKEKGTSFLHLVSLQTEDPYELTAVEVFHLQELFGSLIKKNRYADFAIDTFHEEVKNIIANHDLLDSEKHDGIHDWLQEIEDHILDISDGHDPMKQAEIIPFPLSKDQDDEE